MNMLKRTQSTGRLVVAGAVGLLVVACLGGAALAAAENTGYVEGLELAFSTISTTGFGLGPQTTLGLALTMLVFAAGVACWFAILVAAFESGMRRYAASASPLYGSHRFDMDLRSSKLLGRRQEGHG
jgi:hypothetical protein